MFIIHKLEASRVNFVMNDYVAGLPSPMSMIGLTDTIVRRLGLSPWSGRCLPVFHAAIPSVGRTKPEMDIKGSSFSPQEMVEDMVGRVCVSLIVDLPGCESDAAVADAVLGLRIAGGVIENRRINVSSEAAGGGIFNKIARGYVMVPPTDVNKRKVYGGTQSELQSLANQLFPEKKVPGDGWVIPSAVGHRLLEDPETAPKRSRTRDSAVPHVFVEPLAGMAEMISVRRKSLTGLTADGVDELLWSWVSADGAILGHRAYLQN